MKNLVIILLFSLFILSCSKGEDESSIATITNSYAITLSMRRLEQVGLDPFVVTATLKNNGILLSGKTLTLSVPTGTVSTVTDNSDGTYSFTVTPSSTGEFPVTISYEGVSIKRIALVFDYNISGSGQPMSVPGEYVNTEGYEDGATITPDGEYLFVQYGPVYFSGLLSFSTICSSGSFSVGYDLNNCNGRTNSSLVFETIGPYDNYLRPNFPTGNIVNSELLHLDELVLATVFNGIFSMPTVFYGFKRQSDGTFAEPFKVGFNDENGVNGPFGLSFQMNGDGTAKFAVAWNNYFDGDANGGTTPGEDDNSDIYQGSITLGQDNSFGDVTFATNDAFNSITPSILPINFTTHSGVQGNPHLYYDASGNITSVWTDDEINSHNLAVYRLTAGTYPTGTWVLDTLPSDISTGAAENQPFFTGDKLYFRRDSNIVYHSYTPTNGACSSSFTHNDCWGPENVVIGANGNTGVGEIFSPGEPTMAQRDGKNYLYFVYVIRRENSAVSINDYNVNVGFVEIQ